LFRSSAVRARLITESGVGLDVADAATQLITTWSYRTNPMTDWKPWQLTSSELARQVADLEAEVARVAQGTKACRNLQERLAKLHAEADQRKHSTARHLETAASRYPDDAS
jgi:hypothetical protein